MAERCGHVGPVLVGGVSQGRLSVLLRKGVSAGAGPGTA
jgi:hypothetical protein